MLKAIVVCSFAMALLAVSCGGSSEREANEEILRSLPLPPGTELLSVDSRSYSDCRLIIRRTIGYTTIAKYRAPGDLTDEEIVNFYIEQLSPDWQDTRGALDVEVPAVGQPPLPGDIPMAHFQRGTATVLVQARIPLSGDSAEEATYDFSVTIDSRGIPGRPDC